MRARERGELREAVALFPSSSSVRRSSKAATERTAAAMAEDRNVSPLLCARFEHTHVPHAAGTERERESSICVDTGGSGRGSIKAYTHTNSDEVERRERRAATTEAEEKEKDATREEKRRMFRVSEKRHRQTEKERKENLLLDLEELSE